MTWHLIWELRYENAGPQGFDACAQVVRGNLLRSTAADARERRPLPWRTTEHALTSPVLLAARTLDPEADRRGDTRGRLSAVPNYATI